MFKNNNKLVFHKLIAEIGGSFLDKTIRKYGGDYRSQHFDTKSHINSMIYLNIKDCKSLRTAESEISSNRKLTSLINVPSVSQFSRKNAIVMEERMVHSNPNKDVYDTEVILGSTPGGNLMFNSYRKIMTYDEKGEPVTYLNNILI